MSQKIEDNAGSYGDLVYSPDLQTFDLSGNRGLMSVISSFIVGPIRLVTRVSTNIMLLPSNLLKSYANALIITGASLGAIGLLDLWLRHCWPLLVSQIPVLAIGVKLRISAAAHADKEAEVKRVEFDIDALNNYCNDIQKDLDASLGLRLSKEEE